MPPESVEGPAPGGPSLLSPGWRRAALGSSGVEAGWALHGRGYARGRDDRSRRRLVDPGRGLWRQTRASRPTCAVSPVRSRPGAAESIRLVRPGLAGRGGRVVSTAGEPGPVKRGDRRFQCGCDADGALPEDVVLGGLPSWQNQAPSGQYALLLSFDGDATVRSVSRPRCGAEHTRIRGSSSTTVGRNKPQAAGNSPTTWSSFGCLSRSFVATVRGLMCKDVGRRRDVQGVRLVHFRRPSQ
jgi:hypothetical protein